MIGYLIGCAVAAPVLLMTLLYAAGWILVLRYRAAGQLVDQLVDDQQDQPVVLAPGCQELNLCTRLLASHAPDRSLR